MLATPRVLARMRARAHAALTGGPRRPPLPGAAAMSASAGLGGEDGDDAHAAPLASGPSSTTVATTTPTTASPGTSAGGRRSAYTTLAAPHTHTYEVKKSRFVTTAWPISSVDEAARLVAAARDESASHNVWGLACGAAARCTDDGEPAGTAGRPILAAIEAEGVDGVAVLVVRYRGGPKLGAGGLTRAYAAAARECLRSAPRLDVQPSVGLTISAPLADVGVVYSTVSGAGGQVEGESYGPDGRVCLRASAPMAAVRELVDSLAGRTAGRASAVMDEE